MCDQVPVSMLPDADSTAVDRRGATQNGLSPASAVGHPGESSECVVARSSW